MCYVNKNTCLFMQANAVSRTGGPVRTFEYLKPATLTETVEILGQYGPKARVIAGGTDLMIQWKKKLLSPEYMVSLRNVSELNFIDSAGRLAIGSATRHRTLELSEEIRQRYPIIHDAVSQLGSVQVRNSATIGGNLCNAAPSADTAPPMLVLDAEAVIASAQGQRTIPITQFFKGPGKTVLAEGEILTQLRISEPLPRTGMAYWKHTRRKAMDLPILGVAMLLSFEEDMITCSKARIGLGVAAPTPMRATKAETYLVGKSVTQETLTKAAEIAAGEASPRTTIRGSDWYRRDMIKVLVKRTGLWCAQRAQDAVAPSS